MRMKTACESAQTPRKYHCHFTRLQLMDVLLLASNVALQIKLERDKAI